MTTQTMKRLIALKYTGIKVSDLEIYGTLNEGVTFTHTSGRLFFISGPKSILELGVD